MSLHAGELASVERTSPGLRNTKWRIVAFHLLVFLLAFLILFFRRPDAILNAQFWAEDGKYWYADAYHFGWRCLLMPYNGYLHVPSRLVALFTLLFPFSAAPLVMNLSALCVEILPVHLFLSSRFREIPMSVRIAGSLLYLALPNSYETHANLTNMQWRLVLVCLLVLLGQPQGRKVWKVFDAAVLVTTSLDSVVAILLIPIAAYLRWHRNDKLHNLHLASLVPGSLVQTALILFSHSRPISSNGANLSRLIGILGGQIFFPAVLGFKTSLLLYLTGDKAVFFGLRLSAFVIGLVIVLYCAWRGPIQLKLFIYFAAMLLAVALWNPMVSPYSQTPQWELLQFPGLGNRYYLFPMLSFLAGLIWMLGISTSKLAGPPASKISRFAALIVLTVLPFGIYRDWRYPGYKDFHFPRFAAQFENAGPGTRITIPLNPTGWQMELVRK